MLSPPALVNNGISARAEDAAIDDGVALEAAYNSKRSISM